MDLTRIKGAHGVYVWIRRDAGERSFDGLTRSFGPALRIARDFK